MEKPKVTLSDKRVFAERCMPSEADALYYSEEDVKQFIHNIKGEIEWLDGYNEETEKKIIKVISELAGERLGKW